MFIERRRCSRQNIYLSILIKGNREGKGVCGEETFSVNVSEDGVLFLSRRRWSVGDMLDLVIRVPGEYSAGGRPMQCSTSVMVSRVEQFSFPEDSIEEARYAIAASFDGDFKNYYSALDQRAIGLTDTARAEAGMDNGMKASPGRKRG